MVCIGNHPPAKADSLILMLVVDLITYCAEQKVPFTVFEDWSSILETVKKIVAGEKTVQDAAQEGHEAFQKGEVGLNGHAK